MTALLVCTSLWRYGDRPRAAICKDLIQGHKETTVVFAGEVPLGLECAISCATSKVTFVLKR